MSTWMSVWMMSAGGVVVFAFAEPIARLFVDENAVVDDLLEKARVELDPVFRLELYREAERLIIEDAAWLPLYFSQNHVVVKPEISGWFEPPMVIPRLRFIEVNR